MKIFTEPSVGFPRYFRHIEGFEDGTLYIRCDGPDRVFIVNQARASVYPERTVRECLEKVTRGVWRELTGVEAQALHLPVAGSSAPPSPEDQS